MTDHGYHKMQADHCVFVKKFEGGHFLILLLYDDDMLIVGWGNKEDRKFEESSKKVIHDEGHGTGEADPRDAQSVDQTKKLLWLSQEKYVTKVLQKFNVADAKLVGLTIPTNCKLFGKQSPKTKVDKVEMMKIPYASAV